MRIKVTSRALLTLAVAVAMAVPASAQMGDLEQIGRMGGVPDLGALVKQALSGQVPPEVTVEKFDNGMIKIEVPLRGDGPLRPPTKAKDLINTAITVEILEPTGDAQLLTFDFAPVSEIDYFLGWVTFNIGNQDITATSSLKTRGPGADFNSGNFPVDYGARSFILLVGEMVGGFAPGLHSVDAKVRGAKPGKLKGNFCVDLAC